MINSLENKDLEYIYTHSEGWLNKNQREHFCKYVNEILINPRFQDNTVRDMLWYIWHGYDVGGHSVGRSPRSILLEAAMKAMDNGDTEKAKQFLAVLISMYHNVEYINSHGWYDFKVEHFTDNGLHNLFNLAVVGILLGIEELPNIWELTNNDVHHMVH